MNENELARISEHVTTQLGPYKRAILGPTSKPRKSKVLYVLTRLCEPDSVVETGVQSGISSAFILQALKKNRRGVLYSIDLPDDRLLKIIPSRERKNRGSGWVIPQELVDRWQLTLGRSRDELESVIKRAGQVDIFFHDSEHSYKNMMWEFETAWRYLARGGLLLSDDVHMNKSFHDFCCRLDGQLVTTLLPSLAAVRKL